MPTKPVMMAMAPRPNLNFQYRSPALSLSLNERCSSVSVSVACGAVVFGIDAVGPVVGTPGAGLLEAWVLGEFAFAVDVALAFVASDSLATDFGGGVGTGEGGAAEVASGA
jgi:hypothetical protein